MSVTDIELLIGSPERLRSVFPQVLKITTYLLRKLMVDTFCFTVDRVPMDHYAAAQFRLWSLNVRRQIRVRSITFVCVQDSVSSLFELFRYLIDEAPSVAAGNVRCFQRFCVAVADLGSHLEKIAGVEPIDYLRVAEKLKLTVESSETGGSPPLDPQLPKLSDFEFGKILGAGGFGVAYRALYKPAQVPVCVKLVSESRFGSFENAFIDRTVVSVTNHPLVVDYYYIFPMSQIYLSVMEYVPGVNLHEVVNRCRCLPILHGKLIFMQLALAVAHMHYRGLIHRDIKAENVMVLAGGRVKLLDFDTSKICVAHHPLKLQKSYFQLTAAEFRDRQIAGTLYYMAPELLERRPYGRGCDWWSMGILLFRTIVGRFPFRGKDQNEVKAAILDQKLQFPKSRLMNANVSMVIKFIEKLLEKKPHNRLGSKMYQEIFEDPFLVDVNIGSLTKPMIFEVPELDVALREAELKAVDVFSCVSINFTDRKLDRENTCSQRKVTLSLADLKEPQESTALPPLSVYASKKLEKPREGDDPRMSSLMQSMRFTSGLCDFISQNTLDLPPNEAETVIVIICISDADDAKKLGFSMITATSEAGNVYPIVDRIESKSLASASHLCEGDIITAVNGWPVVNCRIDETRKYLSSLSSDISIYVKSSSPFRLFKNRIDFASVLALYDPIVVRTQATGLSARSRRFFDESRNCFVRTLLLWSAPPGCHLYNGDIISAVDGVTKCLELPTSGQVKLTVIPTSALRRAQCCSDRLLTTYSLEKRSVSRSIASEPRLYISIEEKSSTTPPVESVDEEDSHEIPWIGEEEDGIQTITVAPVLSDGIQNVGDSEGASDAPSGSDEDDD